jgi:hypothetical protein
MKILQMNLISLLKPHQSNDVTILAIPSLNFLTTIRSQTHAIPSTQLAKNIYKLLNHHVAFIKVMHTHWTILLKCNTNRVEGQYHIVLDFFFQSPH